MRFEVTVSKGTVTYILDAKNKAEAVKAVLLADKFYNERDYEVFDIKGLTEDSEVSEDTEKK